MFLFLTWGNQTNLRMWTHRLWGNSSIKPQNENKFKSDVIFWSAGMKWSFLMPAMNSETSRMKYEHAAWNCFSRVNARAMKRKKNAGRCWMRGNIADPSHLERKHLSQLMILWGHRGSASRWIQRLPECWVSIYPFVQCTCGGKYSVPMGVNTVYLWR